MTTQKPTQDPVSQLIAKISAQHACEESSCDARITAWWDTDLHFQPALNERHFHYRIISCIIHGQGVCYVDPEDPQSDSSFLGMCAIQALSVATKQEQIAIIDAMLYDYRGSMGDTHVMDGIPADKAIWRAALVADAVRDTLGDGETRVHMIGVVGLIARELITRGLTVTATDMDPTLSSGQSPQPFMVQPPIFNKELIAQCDLVLATGMTLGNGTFLEILEQCQSQGKRLALYAETGSAIAEYLAVQGVIHLSISEPYPFYIAQGLSAVRITRSRAARHD